MVCAIRGLRGVGGSPEGREGFQLVLIPVDKETTNKKSTQPSIFCLSSHLPSLFPTKGADLLAVEKKKQQNEVDIKHLKIQKRREIIYELQVFPSSLKRTKYKNHLFVTFSLFRKREEIHCILQFSVHIMCVCASRTCFTNEFS